MAWAAERAQRGRGGRMSTSDFDPFGTDSSENWRPSHRIKLEGVPDLRKGERFSPFGKIQTTTASNQATGRPVLSIRGPLRSEQREVATLLEDAKLWIQRFMSLSPAQADV